MINDIKALLGAAADNYTEAQIGMAWKLAAAEVERYCGRTLNADLELIAVEIAIIKLNRLGTEGLASQGYSGVSEAYIDGYPAHITAALNRKRLIKAV